MKYSHPASLACQVRAAIRFKRELPYQTFVDIFRGRQGRCGGELLYLK